MKKLLLIVLILFACEKNSQNNDDIEYSILGLWLLDESSSQICDFIDGECVDCQNKFGGTEPNDINIVNQIATVNILESSFTFDWCYSFDGYQDIWCSDNEFTWDELNSLCTSCVNFEEEIVNISDDQICLESGLCFGFSLLNSGNSAIFNSTDGCQTFKGNK